MSAPPFVVNVRSRRGSVLVGNPDGAALNLRVQMPDIWDVVRIVAAPGASVADVKRAALDALAPGADEARYVMKLRGIEVLDESQPLTEAGAIDGSIFLLTHRRRRPVR
ncbi:MAG TPA: hypothetical protein VFS05_12230 [Gemmatimonadaceae bacterium]|nr:hypothetical protein [Gemmatimonadaceae bacterium]